ncbi:MAG TPA: hypothetical protein VN426_15105 [Syntrophomonadaceae bacterium]|nr:hypothetical protein [Syntrophomonadaceae bacterium]
MLMWLILLVFIAVYIKLEAIGLYQRRQFPEMALAGFLWVVVLTYAIALQLGVYNLPNPSKVFDLFRPLIKVVISG